MLPTLQLNALPPLRLFIAEGAGYPKSQTDLAAALTYHGVLPIGPRAARAPLARHARRVESRLRSLTP
jgi:hypothetical protein